MTTSGKVTTSGQVATSGRGIDQTADSKPSNAEDVLMLVNGDTLGGQLIDKGEGEYLRWQATSFTDPFDFDFSAIKSIRFAKGDVDAPQPTLQDLLVFELTNGDSIYGRIRTWNEQRIKINAIGFGELNLRPASIRSLYRTGRKRDEVFASLSGNQDWEGGAWKFDRWRRDGNHLWTQSVNASLSGSLSLPRRSLLDLELSWSGRANWEVRFGDVDGSESLLGFVASNGRLSVTNTMNSSEPSQLMDLRQKQSLRLSVCIDTINHQMRVFDDRDRLLGSFELDPTERSTESARVVNKGGSLRLERLRVAQWRGPLPNSMVGIASLALTDGTLVSGLIGRFNPDEKQLQWRDNESKPVRLSDLEVVRIRRFATMPERPQCALFLIDGQRLSGDLQSVDSKQWVLSGRHFDRPVTISRPNVRSMVVFNNQTTGNPSRATSGRPGRLQIGTHSVSGSLSSSQSEIASRAEIQNRSTSLGLRWHPYGAKASSALTKSASGRIVYRESASRRNDTMTAQAMEMQQQRLQRQRRGLNFGELFLRRIDNAGATEPEKDAHVIHTRLGDAIACRVESINESGVQVSTALSNNQWIPHTQIKAIELAAHSPPPELDTDKRDRLLTIPRLQKMLPPTHLLCSYNGDFLRCRLLEMDVHRVLVEVRSKTMEIPRERIAQVIWFHPDEWETSEDSSGDATATTPANSIESLNHDIDDGSDITGKIQVLKRDGKRVTFSLDRVEANTITGNSDLVGPCRFTLNEIDQIIFGEQIASEVSGLAYNQWKLQPALEPLVMQSDGNEKTPQEISPLVGKLAPNVYLEQLDGKELRLSSYRGKIVILDFWASWCAPCTTTMPLIEALVADQDPNQVLLIAVNVEESLDRVAGFAERQQLGSLVARDVDGAASEKYRVTAIPQWVVIDQEGKITSTHTGGGQESVERLEKAIGDLLNVQDGQTENEIE
ncbi:MAG: TlpA disulfide reductase family protein [Planctomycetota bacterium]